MITQVDLSDRRDLGVTERQRRGVQHQIADVRQRQGDTVVAEVLGRLVHAENSDRSGAIAERRRHCLLYDLRDAADILLASLCHGLEGMHMRIAHGVNANHRALDFGVLVRKRWSA